jgi:hypothetical protein
MGTPYYVSPEQANGSREADARSDLYAMGVILYECVTGAVPFDGKTFNELLFKIVLSDAPLARQLAPHLDPAFEAIISKAMARDVAQRFQTCEEFADALRAYQRQRGTSLADASGQVPMVPIALPAVSQPAPRGVGQSTAASWSNTGMHVPKRSNAALVAALLGGGLLVLGGGAFAAYKVMHGSGATAAASAGPSAETEVKAPTQVTTPTQVTAPPEVIPSPLPADTVSAPTPSASKPPEATATAKAAPARVTGGGRIAPRATPPAVAPPPVAPPPPVVAAPPPTATAKKKNPNSTTDFGY